MLAPVSARFWPAWLWQRCRAPLGYSWSRHRVLGERGEGQPRTEAAGLTKPGAAPRGSHLWCQEPLVPTSQPRAKRSEVNSAAFVGEKKKKEKKKKPICTPKCFPGCFVPLLSQRDAFKGLQPPACGEPSARSHPAWRSGSPCPLGEAIACCGFPRPTSVLLQIITPPSRSPTAQHEGKSRSTPRARRCPPRARPQQPL